MQPRQPLLSSQPPATSFRTRGTRVLRICVLLLVCAWAWSRVQDGVAGFFREVFLEHEINQRFSSRVEGDAEPLLDWRLASDLDYTAADVCPCAHRPGDERYQDQQYFALCLATKQHVPPLCAGGDARREHENIREWVAHHAHVGAGRMYIYDTGSDPPLNETLHDFIATGLVHYTWWPPDFGGFFSRRYPQLEIYDDCLQRHRRQHQFIGFIDSDEFLIPKGGLHSVPALLRHMQAFEPIGGLGVSWVMFGSSGHVRRPENGTLQAYRRCHPLRNEHTRHIKSIVNTDFARHARKNPHEFLYRRGRYAVNEHFQRIRGPWYSEVTVDKIALHHYIIRSYEALGSAMGNHRANSFFRKMDRAATETCTAAVDFGPYT